MVDFLKKKKYGKAPKAFGGRSKGGKSGGFKGFKMPKPAKPSMSGDSVGAKPRAESPKPKASGFKSFGSGAPRMSDGARKRLEKIQI